jgi:hypothetical protein
VELKAKRSVVGRAKLNPFRELGHTLILLDRVSAAGSSTPPLSLSIPPPLVLFSQIAFDEVAVIVFEGVTDGKLAMRVADLTDGTRCVNLRASGLLPKGPAGPSGVLELHWAGLGHLSLTLACSQNTRRYDSRVTNLTTPGEVEWQP